MVAPLSDLATALPGAPEGAEAAGTGACAARPEAAAPGRGAADEVGVRTSRAELPPPRDHALRRDRYRRRQRSSSWLIGMSREAAGLPVEADEVADPETGELRPIQATDDAWIRPPRVARCRWRMGEQVNIHRSADHGAHWSGIERCGSIWACPVCAAVIRAGRSVELGKASQVHRENGGSLVFVTLTMRHGRKDPLNVTLDAALRAWQRMLQGKAWGTFKERFEVSGYVRAVEITHGKNGWHPHIHALFFVGRPITEAEVDEWERLMYVRWARYVEKFGGGMPNFLRGVDVRSADDDGQAVTQYLTKLQESTEGKRQKIENELVRSDMKSGRGKAGRAPFELLDDGRPGDDKLWQEYYQATHGRRAITWSKGLRKALLPDDADKTDEELLEEGARKGVRVITIPAKKYDQARNDPGMLALALDLVERGHDAEAALLIGGWVVPETDEAAPRPEDRAPSPDPVREPPATSRQPVETRQQLRRQPHG